MTWEAVLVLSIVAGALAFRWFINANPAALARRIRFGAILLGVLLVIGLAAVGRSPWLLGLLLPMAPLIIRALLRRQRAPADEWEGTAGEQSKVQTAHLDMTFDHDSGELDGRVTAGSFAGIMLSVMSMAEVRSLLDEILAGGDDESASILTSYLDRRFGDAWHDSSAQSGAHRARNSESGAMSAEEAWRVLGLSPGASKDEIRSAHRRLMKQLHPDHGGSDYLASKINEAKDVLLRA